jgi:medium-chain acyl-[acyl-carrier-protein] hydrolase
MINQATRNRSTEAAGWIVCQQPRPAAPLRLICFPHAGGSPWLFRNWWQRMPIEIEIGAIQLPGHGSRLREAPFNDFPALIEQIGEELRTRTVRPFALFGHSLGALMAFELARLLRDSGRPGPTHLFVSGQNAPQMPRERDALSKRNDSELIDGLRQLNCTPEQLLDSQELMELMLPVIRADLELYENYRYRLAEPLECPLTVMGGLDDPRTDLPGLEGWKEHTRNRFQTRRFPGDHFFVATQEPLVTRTIAQELERDLPFGASNCKK